jgi:hypothetical protein
LNSHGMGSEIQMVGHESQPGKGSNPFGRASKQNQWVTAKSSGISGSH